MKRENQVAHAAMEKLEESSHLFLRHVHCYAKTGDLYLEGKVPSYYLKQTAQSLIQSIEGVGRVVNRLQVVNAGGVSGDPVEKEIANLPIESVPNRKRDRSSPRALAPR